MKNLYILGNGGFANYLYNQIVKKASFASKYIFKGFIIIKDGKAFCVSENGLQRFAFPPQSSFILGTNKTKYRQEFLELFSDYYTFDKETFPNIIVGSGFIDTRVEKGYGNVICDFASILGPSKIGNFNCLNMYSCIQHNTKVGSYNIFSPYAVILPKSKIQDYNFLGTHSMINKKIQIGSNNTISAGECLFDDIEDNNYFQSGFAEKKPG